MEYKLVSAPMLDTIERVVNEAMAEGWTPHGSLVSTEERYIQPMVRHYGDGDGKAMWTTTYAVAAEAE